MQYMRDEFRKISLVIPGSTFLQTASYIIGFHQSPDQCPDGCPHIRILGFGDEQIARAVYDAVSSYAKVLMNKQNSQVSF